MDHTNAIRRKLVIIGDSACGKTSLLSIFTLGNFPALVDGKAVELALWDTAGLEGYARLRPLAYTNANIILIGFSIDNPCSLDNVKDKWSKEATRLCPGVPTVLVSLKKDLREDPIWIREIGESSLLLVTEHEGEMAAHEIGAKMYLECSSLSGEGVDTVFEIASRLALLGVQKAIGEGCCPIL
ncbi:P-loop containing nucleoside triphosphate hydrolase protein [Fusarium sp. MPI-SDFR-AT-0072]|nr:P-loop containing nucleoside triphosphate hydrolase protein [Fusarium sp. MPI-SDFR-AT-0072]